MEVVLLVERRDEAIRLVAVDVEAARGGRRHGSRRIPARAGDPGHDGAQDPARGHHRARCETRSARTPAAAPSLVYVPHTTAGLTINEKIDPDLLDDFEMALDSIADDDWSWKHVDADGPNAPSHMRASLLGPQVLVPLRDGDLALGTYQGIFFCEFDGPRSRKVYVSTLI